jgi:hypothetical protein
MIALLILVSLICFAAMIYMNWNSGIDLGIIELGGYLMAAALPGVNVVFLLLQFGDYATRNNAGIILNGRDQTV